MSLQLSETDHERVLDLGWSLGDASSEEELIAIAMEKTLALTGCDETAVNEIDLTTGNVEMIMYPHVTVAPSVS